MHKKKTLASIFLSLVRVTWTITLSAIKLTPCLNHRASNTKINLILDYRRPLRQLHQRLSSAQWNSPSTASGAIKSVPNCIDSYTFWGLSKSRNQILRWTGMKSTVPQIPAILTWVCLYSLLKCAYLIWNIIPYMRMMHSFWSRGGFLSKRPDFEAWGCRFESLLDLH